MRVPHSSHSTAFLHNKRSRFSFITATILPPAIVAWDEFLDFTRMAPTKHGLWRSSSVLMRRLQTNIGSKFTGNYSWLCITLLIITGIFSSTKLLIACIISTMLWVCLCFLTDWDETYDTFHHRNTIIPKEEREIYGIFITIIVFIFSSASRKAAYVILLSLALSCLHAMFRPVPGENVDKRKKQQVVASDGFVEDVVFNNKAEETVLFIDDLSTATLRQRAGNSTVPSSTTSKQALPGIILPLGDGCVKRC